MAAFVKIAANNKQGYKWVCTKDGPPDPVTGKRKQIARRGDTRKDAEARVDKAIEKMKETKLDEKMIKNLKFDQVAEEWLDVYSRRKVKKGTIRVRKKEIKILNRYIAKIGIADVTSRDHQKILNDMAERGYTKKDGTQIEYAKTTMEGVHTTAGMIFKYAIKEKYRKDNPCVGAVIPEKLLTVEDIEKDPIQEKYFERDELTEFLDALKVHGLKMDIEIFNLLAFSGMRNGELCALKWLDLNFDTNEIRITKTLYNPDNNMRSYELTPPKTKGSIRTISIDPAVMKLLKEHHRQQAKSKLANRVYIEDFHDKGFVFCRPNGYPFIQKNIIQRMQRLLKKTTISKHATPHIFRHTYISMLAEAEVDINTIMQRVGHEDMKTTMQIYTHVTKKMQKNADQKLNAVFGDLLRF